MADTDILLHAKRVARVPFFAGSLRRHLTERLLELRRRAGTRPDPGLTVLIRTKNDAARLESLFEDIAAQDFDGPVQVVVVDTESTDGTVEIARRHNATIVPITQQGF